MDEHKVIEVFARIEDEQESVKRGVRGAVGLDMSIWFAEGVNQWFSGRNLTICGTVACFAGHAALASGWEPQNSELCRNIQDGSLGRWEDVGASVCGLSAAEANDVFYLDELDEVYRWFAREMGIEEVVLRDKVQAVRHSD